MKKIYINLLISIITIFFLFEIFNYTDIVIKTIIDGSILWFTNIVPSLFPIFIITDILSNYKLINYMSNYIGKIFKIFNLPKESAFAFIMAIFSGFPSNAKFIKELLDNNIINSNEATRLLTFTHFSNPLFIIGSLGILILNNKQIGIIILIVHYLTNIIIGLLFKNVYIYENKKRTSMPKNYESFVPLLKKSILNTINTLFLIYGIIIFFMIVTTILNKIITMSFLNQVLLNGSLEMTQGLKLISSLNANIIIKSTIATFIISFGGIAIHMQIMSILSEYKINYYIYFISRLLHASLSSIIVYIILTLANY